MRELENLVEREMIRSGGAPLPFDEIGASGTSREGPPAARRGPIRLDGAMAAHIESVLAMTSGKIHGPGGAAELLGLHATPFGRTRTPPRGRPSAAGRI